MLKNATFPLESEKINLFPVFTLELRFFLSSTRLSNRKTLSPQTLDSDSRLYSPNTPSHPITISSTKLAPFKSSLDTSFSNDLAEFDSSESLASLNSDLPTTDNTISLTSADSTDTNISAAKSTSYVERQLPKLNPIESLIDIGPDTEEPVPTSFPPSSYSLAHTPTPIDKVSLPKKPPIWIKRDDLTGIGCSGNKIRKLNYLLWDAVNNYHATDIITCGGIQSNHCRATAVASRILGLTPHLLLRVKTTAEFATTNTGNFLLDKLIGASIHPCSYETYSDGFLRQKAMETIKSKIEKNPERKAYIIGEGGSNQLGSFGYIECFAEILKYSHFSVDSAKFTKIVVPCGSGGTLAGLLIGQALTKTVDIEIVAIAVTDTEKYWREIVSNIFKDFNDTWAHIFPTRLKEPLYRVVTKYQGAGYGLADETQIKFMRDFTRCTGIFLDPSYTGKCLLAVYDLLEQDFFDPDDTICVIHTGGIFGLLGNEKALSHLLYS